MQRLISILFGVGAVALAVVLAYKSMPARPEAALADGGADAGAVGEGGPKAAVADIDAPDLLADLPLPSGPDPRTVENGPGSRMPDGTPVPPLPENTPRQVRFGVVLVTYAGAQGAPPNARPKKEALDLVTKLGGDAKADFHGAVVRGDTGSIDDAGHMPRGVLELATEYILFTMPVGGVSDPLETPRGYWIAKRIE